MADISEYAAKILTEEDRPLFQEAVASALHGAPRGAYILIWIACAEGLKRKFREAVVRDGNANKSIKRIEQAESNHHSADIVILDEAKNHGFINDVAHQKLKYVYDMRCVYGHPYEEAPDDEEIINAAAVVVHEVLGRPTLLRHGFVQTLINNLFTDVNYLEHSEASVRSFAREMSVHVDPLVYAYVLEKTEPSYDDVSLEVVITRSLWFLSEFLLSVGCNFYSATQWHGFAAKYSKSAQHIILSDGRLFEAVGKRPGDYIVAYNITHADDRPSRLKEVERLMDGGLLSDDQKGKLQSLDILTVKAANFKISTCYDAMISALKSYNWQLQNPAIDLIAAKSKREIAALSPEIQEELGRNILQAADGSSWSALRYLSTIHNDQNDWLLPFLKGLLFEVFVNERLEFRFKEVYPTIILDLLASKKDIEADLVEAIDASKPKSWRWMSEKMYRHILDLTKEKPDLNSLVEALERNREKLISTSDW
ncbi:MAG TPA: hypothetical protein VFV38_21225 [Ktedonobacteraceae bacterium]|nr:hypothetical protein [Ktedonobacteraceae bacterium]